MAWEIFAFSTRTWLLIGLTAGTIILAVALFFGLDLDRKRVARHVYRPSRSNLRGIHVNLPSGQERVDWKKGYSDKYNMVYLQGRKAPVLNVIPPRDEDIRRYCPYATVFPVSIKALMFGDPRGRVLDYYPPALKEIRLNVPDAFGKMQQVVIPRDFKHSVDVALEEGLQDLELREELESAHLSSFQKSQVRIQEIEGYGEAFGKILSGMGSLLSGQKKGGGGGS